MVMSAGQRAVLARNEENEAKKRFDQNYESTRSDEFTDYDNTDYVEVESHNSGIVTTKAKNQHHKRIRGKQQQQQQKSEKHHKSKALSSTIGPKLQNLQYDVIVKV